MACQTQFSGQNVNISWDANSQDNILLIVSTTNYAGGNNTTRQTKPFVFKVVDFLKDNVFVAIRIRSPWLYENGLERSYFNNM
jgi:hypothetical protein